MRRTIGTSLLAAALCCSGAAAALDGAEHFTGRLVPRESVYLSAPVVPGMSRMTVTYIAGSGRAVRRGERVLQFDSATLDGRADALQSERRQLERELARLRLADAETADAARLTVEEMEAELAKARRRAAIPQAALSRHEWQRHQLERDVAEVALANQRDAQAWSQDAARLEIDIVEGRLARIDRELGQLRDHIASMTVTAPHDAIAILLADPNGKPWSSGDEVFTSQRLLELPKSDDLVVELQVPERSYRRIGVGQRMVVQVEAIPDQEFAVTLRAIAGSVHSRSRFQPAMVVDVVAEFDGAPHAALRPGLTVTGRFSP